MEESKVAADDLQRRLAVAEQRLRDCTAERDTAVAGMQRLTAEIGELRAELQRLAPLPQQVADAQVAVDAAQQRVRDVEQQYAQSVKAVADLQIELDRCKYQTPFADAN